MRSTQGESKANVSCEFESTRHKLELLYIDILSLIVKRLCVDHGLEKGTTTFTTFNFKYAIRIPVLNPVIVSILPAKTCTLSKIRVIRADHFVCQCNVDANSRVIAGVSDDLFGVNTSDGDCDVDYLESPEEAVIQKTVQEEAAKEKTTTEVEDIKENLEEIADAEQALNNLSIMSFLNTSHR
ncbi:hypothetical protein Tco_0009783 [Tanacetum coccineum]